MQWPAFNDEEDLQVRLSRAGLREVLDHFGQSSTRRQIIATRLERIYQLACSTGQVARFAVFGSFVTEKDEPNDVDVIMIMEDSFDLASVSGEAALVFQHSEADAHFGAS